MNMDQDNLNASFDNLFEDNAGRGWIVTKQEKGKVKVAPCREDEIDDLYVTRTDWVIRNVDEDENQATTSNSDSVHKWQIYGTAMFLVRDMLNCETRNGYFLCKNIPFMDVLICGTVVSLSTRFDKYAIVVDDGTSSIMCLIKQEELIALQMSEDDKKKDRELRESLKANPSDSMTRACAMVMRAIKDLYKNVPAYDDLRLGDIVTIIGTLSEYKNNRYIFIKSLEKEPEDSISHITHLEKLLDLYTNSYEDC